MMLRGPHRRRLRAPVRRQRRRRLPRLQARGAPVQGAGRRRRHPEHRLGRRPGGLGRHGVRRHQGRACTSSPRRSPSRARRSASGSTRSARRACRSPASWPPAGWRSSEDQREQIAERVGAMHPLGRPITAEDCAEAAVFLCRTRRRTSPACCCRSTAGTWRDDGSRRPDCSTATGSGELFDLRSSYIAFTGGGYTDDPYPRGTSSASEAPVHEGIVHELTGFEGDAFFHGLPYPGPPALLGVQLRGLRRGLPQRRGVRLVAADAVDPTPAARRDQQHADDGRRAAPPLPRARAAVVRAGQGAVVDRRTGSRTRCTR